MKKIGILSLGCPRNLVDSENITGRLSLKGYDIVDVDKADIALINTCAFIEDAKVESIDAILNLVKLKKQGRLKKIIVYGCLSQRYRDELRKELPEVDAFVGKVSLNHELKRFPITPDHFAYLKICEGCINNCSFCIIPKIKGEFTSLDRDSVLKKVEDFSREGKAELNIIGQDITGYGVDLYKSYALSGLLKNIVKKARNIGWIRLLYLNPSRINDELLKIIKGEEKVCKYIDLPVQHINNRILKLMNRKCTKEDIMRLIDKIRKEIPQAAIRTSVIVGFPSETDKEFRELLKFIEDVKFDRLGAFIYSREEGTRAYDFKKQIPRAVKESRFDLVMSRQQGISNENNKKLIRKTLKVLIEEERNGSFIGRSEFDAPEVDGEVFVKSAKKLYPGDFVQTKITGSFEYDLIGEA